MKKILLVILGFAIIFVIGLYFGQTKQYDIPLPLPFSSPTPVSERYKACMDKLATRKKSDYVQGKIIVGFRSNVTLSRAEELMRQFSLVIPEENENKGRLNLYHYLLVETPKGKEKELSCQLQELSEVEYAELDGIMRIN